MAEPEAHVRTVFSVIEIWQMKENVDLNGTRWTKQKNKNIQLGTPQNVWLRNITFSVCVPEFITLWPSSVCISGIELRKYKFVARTTDDKVRLNFFDETNPHKRKHRILTKCQKRRNVPTINANYILEWSVDWFSRLLSDLFIRVTFTASIQSKSIK